MRVGLVHHWMTKMRGGEKVLEVLCEMFPEADIFTHVVDRSAMSDKLLAHKIDTTFIAKMPFAKTQYQKYLPFMPRALEELDLRAYDLLISIESGPSKGIIPRPDAFHLCYCNSPMRYIWDHYHDYKNSSGFIARQLFPGIAHRLRTWDVASAARVDQFVSNSSYIAQRVDKYYRRDSDVVFPPADTSAFEALATDDVEDFYLAAGEFVDYKRFDLAVEAFTKLGRRMIVIGDGEQRKHLEKIAGPNISFLGRVDFETLKSHFARCKALIFPGEEDFGLVPVEVMAAGRPVIAFGRGGALDTVIPDKSGVLFYDQTVDSIIEAVERFETKSFDRLTLQAHARTFSKDAFKAGILKSLRKNGVPV